MNELIKVLYQQGIFLKRIVNDRRAIFFDGDLMFNVFISDDFGARRWASNVRHIDMMLRRLNISVETDPV